MNYKKALSCLAPGLNRGFFIALEGLDGAGKSLQAEALRRRLEGFSPPPLLVKEPTDGQFGRVLKNLSPAARQKMTPAEEAALFAKDRAEDVAENIAPALLAGRPVLADRYIASSVAYQAARGLSRDKILSLNKDFPWPDLTVILDLPLELALARLRERAREDPAFERPEYLAVVQRIFADMEIPNLIRLDGREAPEAITERIVGELESRGLLRREKPPIVDAHAHLRLAESEDIEGTLARARQVGVVAVMDVALNAEHAKTVIERASEHRDIHPVVGWHPHDVKDMDEGAFRDLMELASRPDVVGFGEIGLDFCLMRSPREVQLAVFEKFLEAASDLDKPVVIHSREAFRDTLRLLEKYAPRLKRPGIIHCFTRGWEEAAAYLDLGFYLSLPGVVTFPNSHELRDAAAKMPEDKILVETDAPFMAPAPFRGRKNEPSFLIYHLEAIAAARGATFDEAARLTTANARRAYKLL